MCVCMCMCVCVCVCDSDLEYFPYSLFLFALYITTRYISQRNKYSDCGLS